MVFDLDTMSLDIAMAGGTRTARGGSPARPDAHDITMKNGRRGAPGSPDGPACRVGHQSSTPPTKVLRIRWRRGSIVANRTRLGDRQETGAYPPGAVDTNETAASGQAMRPDDLIATRDRLSQPG
ncbi:hypothetical protein [Burkholderia cepacia]|uniref:hypothetical protein n=1 Tax=Burkholderia cepacia TaxID=292 RepID=UPI00158CF11A|nr:hypothetical protein [Burkholderia cepacia]